MRAFETCLQFASRKSSRDGRFKLWDTKHSSPTQKTKVIASRGAKVTWRVESDMLRA